MNESQGASGRGVDHRDELNRHRPSSQILRDLILDLVPRDRSAAKVQETAVHRTRVRPESNQKESESS